MNPGKGGKRPGGGQTFRAGLLLIKDGKGTVSGILSREARGADGRPRPQNGVFLPICAALGATYRIVPHGRDGVILREPMLVRSLLPVQDAGKFSLGPMAILQSVIVQIPISAREA